MGSVTPITSGPSKPTGGDKPARAPRKHRGKALRLSDSSNDDDGFTTLDVVNGLRGVCSALDWFGVSGQDIDVIADLSIAAKVMSRILGDRVEI